MSESFSPTTSSDTGTRVHSFPPFKPGTSLLDFSPNATFRVWRKPPTGVEPQDGGSLHVSELIPGYGDHVLVCFATMATDDWDMIRRELETGDKLGLSPLLVGTVDRAHIASGLWGAGMFAGRHGLTKERERRTIFSPNQTLMRLLRIDRGSRTRNALVLIRNGRVVAEWFSGGDGDKPHDWTTILAMVD